MTETEKKEKPIHATISAKVLDALGPMIKEVQDFIHSEEAFYGQVQRQAFGLHVVPAEKGTIVAVIDTCRMLAVHDPEGSASEAIRLHLPDDLIDAAAIKQITLRDENDSPFMVDVHPKPHHLFCHNGFGLLLLEKPSDWHKEQYEGVLGSWHNGDTGSTINLDSYRCEPATLKHVRVMLSKLPSIEAASGAMIDLSKLETMGYAARRLGIPVNLMFAGEKGCIRMYSEHEGFFGLLMPLGTESETDLSKNTTFETLLNAGAERAATA
ncbi:MAG TPA: hypothetical protein VEF04_04700 [Blastocatellia bacterium]|nr:hypothetical protein [Blastocatellia bacterium]